jgi:cysteine-rich repeat protein
LNGCETPLYTDSNCGWCGDSCASNEVCNNDNAQEIYQCDCFITDYTPKLNTFCGSKVVTDNCGDSYSMTGTIVCGTGTSCNPATGLCKLNSVCGNGAIETGETCDQGNGNVANGDGCSSTCQIESGWNCPGTPSVCQKCGNGIKEGTEACDDGDTTGGDGCSATCTLEGNGWVCTGTSPTVCQKCGNGIIEGTESCDDGDATAGDGCSATCTTESQWSCTGQPSVCQKCGNSIREGSETCDGTSQGCTVSGNPGTQSCNSQCNGWNACTATQVCPNNNIEGTETCDSNSRSCTTSSGYAGSQSCNSQCNGWNSCSSSLYCGDGTINGPEVCDGSSFGGKTCVSQLGSGYTGSLSCQSSCSLIGTSGCCKPTTCAALGYECGTWSNGCGGNLNCGSTCSGGATCQSGSCVCNEEDYVGCSGGDAYWYDSCDVRGSFIEDCNDGDSCTTDSCSVGSGCTHTNTCECTSATQCNDNVACTTDTCSGGNCINTQKSCGVNNDGCCPSGCTSLSDNNCVASCGNGVIESGEECDGNSALGGETCASILGSGYTGTLRCSFCSFDTSSCVAPCSLTDAYWSTTSTFVGTPVSLITSGTSSCNAKSINFEVREDNLIGTSHVSNPTSKTMTSGTASGAWTPAAKSPSGGYYFIATVAGTSENIESDRLTVTESVTCPNGQCTGGETCSTCAADCGSCCGNGACDGALGETCTTCAADCGTCPPPQWCGDTFCNNGETCTTCATDCGSCSGPCGDGTCNNGEDCSTCATDCGGCCGNGACDNSVGEDCSTCATDCGNCNGICGDGTLDSDEECDDHNLINGDGCSSLCTDEITPPSDCVINSATWSTTSALDDETVSLNIQGTSCDGETISFVVLEKDGLLNTDDPVTTDPENIIYSQARKSGSWIAEWQNDDEGLLSGQTNPPEFYFKVIVNGEEKKRSSELDADMLKIYQGDVVCSGSNYCSKYLTEEECQTDLCNVGLPSAPAGITCGQDYDELTGCYFNTNCGCGWNSNTLICESEWSVETNCESHACVPYEDECWLAGDLCQDDCTCYGPSNPDGSGACTYDSSGICDDTKECWLAGDKCKDDCTCENGYDANGEGSCGNGPACVPYENECWLAGDLCQYDCTCYGPSNPDGSGACTYSASEVCGDSNECWLAGDSCKEDCTCKDNTSPDNEGSCLGSGVGIRPNIGTCLYTENSLDTCTDDGMLTRSLGANWLWDNENSFSSIPSGDDSTYYVQDVESGVYRYDPLKKSQTCVYIEDNFVCPGSVQVPFFGLYQLIITIAIVVLIYLIYILKKKKGSKKKIKKNIGKRRHK